jgi:DNA-binding PadR family transcriptional regulator
MVGLMSKNELVVLGFLNQKPMHGYQLHQEIEKTGMEVWAEVKLSSIYNTLNRLEEKHMVEAKREKPGKMPERSVYHVTRDGKEKLASLLEQVLSNKRIHPANLMLGIFFIKGLPKRKALECLKTKVEVMEKLHQSLLEAEKDIGAKKPFPWTFFMRGTIDHLRDGIKRIDDLTKHIQRMHSWK